MARFRLSDLAKRDIAIVLRRNEQEHGREARIRYRALLSASLRWIAEDPRGPTTSNRGDLHAGIRSLHLRHGRRLSREAPVAAPVHVIFYRIVAPDLIDIVRVLHERMDAGRHISSSDRRRAQ